MSGLEFSDLFLEHYLAGELKPAEKKEFEAKLAADPALAARLRAIKTSNEEILAHYPADKMAAAIRDAWASSQDAGPSSDRRERPGDRRERPARQKAKDLPPETLDRKKRPLYLWLTPVLVLGIAAFIWFSPLHLGDHTATRTNPIGSDLENPSGIRFKGEDQLHVYLKKSGAEAKKLEPGQVVRSGDVVQLAYLSAGNPFGAIFSIDGRGNVTRHFPEKAEGRSAALTPGKKTFLAESYELDDAPRYEIFFLITSREKLDLPAVLTRASNLAKTPDASESQSRAAFNGFRVSTFKILKQNPSP